MAGRPHANFELCWAIRAEEHNGQWVAWVISGGQRHFTAGHSAPQAIASLLQRLAA